MGLEVAVEAEQVGTGVPAYVDGGGVPPALPAAPLARVDVTLAESPAALKAVMAKVGCAPAETPNPSPVSYTVPFQTPDPVTL